MRRLSQGAIGFTPMGRGFNALGIGDNIINAVIPFLFYAIWIIMPALACTALTAEKEGNTMGNLLLTRLSPSKIILEKLGSRLVPMLTILCIAVPMLGYTYTLGGVDTSSLVVAIWLLFCECLLMASIGIMCSSWFTTSVGAFIASYTLVVMLAVSTLVMGMRPWYPSALWFDFYLGDGMQRIGWQLNGGPGPGFAPSSLIPGWMQLLLSLIHI